MSNSRMYEGEVENVVVTMICTISLETTKDDADNGYNELEHRKNGLVQAIESLGFEVVVEDQQ